MSVDTTWSHGEAVIRRFEAAWRQAERPDLSSFVTPGTEYSTRLLTELAHVDLEFRLQAGEPARVEDYLVRFPDLAQRDVVLDLIITEFGLRNRGGRSPQPEEYFTRFPEYRSELERLLAAGVEVQTRSPHRWNAEPVGTPVVPGCEVGDELGRGGMGVVYKAFQPALGRTVAVKTLAAEDADTSSQFRREAETVARLDHPHVVPIYEVGTWSTGNRAVPYFVMKWYTGGSLDAVPCGLESDPVRHARIVEAVARAVHHAHQRGVLHRDLKPSNILLDDDGNPHVADFGLAGRFDPTSPHAPTGGVVGTPSYMAPEQAHAPARVTTAVDVYGLGAVLYHLLTGRPPFRGATALATLELLRSEEPERPSALNPAVPRDLEAICLKCLRKDPERRYASADAVAADLQRWLTGRPVTARRVSSLKRTWLWARRHPLQAALTGLTALAVVATGVSLVVGHAQVREKERETASALDREKRASRDLAATLSREQEALYLERVSSAGRLYAANQLPQAWKLLDDCACDLYGWEWRVLDGFRRSAPQPIGAHSEWVTGAAFLADGRLATADIMGELRIWSPDGTEQRKWQSGRSAGSVWAHPKLPWFAIADRDAVVVWHADTAEVVHRIPSAQWAVFAPSGNELAVGIGAITRVYKTADWALAREFTGHKQMVLTAAFSPDGKRLVTSGFDRTIRTWDLATGAAVGAPWPRPDSVRRLLFAADGKTLIEDRANGAALSDPENGMILATILPETGRSGLAVGPNPRWAALSGPNSEVQVLDVATRRPVMVFRGHTGPPSALAISADGRRLASAGGDRTVRLWALDRPPECDTLPPVGNAMFGLAVTHDGKRVAVAPSPLGKSSDEVRQFDPADGREVLRVPGSGDVVFSPDGTWFVVGRRDGGVTVHVTADGAKKWAAPGDGSPAVRLAVSLDSRWVAAVDLKGAVRVWDVASGKPVSQWLEPRGPAYGLAFISGGRLVATGRDGCIAWNVESRDVAWTTSPGALNAAVSPDGKRLVTVDRDRIVRLRDSETGQTIRPFVGASPNIGWAAFSPDGRRLVTGDRHARIWNVETGQELLTLPGTEGDISAVAWVGPRVYALDDRVRIWTGGSE